MVLPEGWIDQRLQNDADEGLGHPIKMAAVISKTIPSALVGMLKYSGLFFGAEGCEGKTQATRAVGVSAVISSEDGGPPPLPELVVGIIEHVNDVCVFQGGSQIEAG